MSDEELKKINKILQENKHLNFVQRILSPQNYPTLDLGNGNYATHKMAYSDVGGLSVAYPTVIHDEKNNKALFCKIYKKFDI